MSEEIRLGKEMQIAIDFLSAQKEPVTQGAISRKLKASMKDEFREGDTLKVVWRLFDMGRAHYYGDTGLICNGPRHCRKARGR